MSHLVAPAPPSSGTIEPGPWWTGVVRSLIGFVLGSIAQGIPLIVIVVELDARDAGPTWLAAVAAARLVPYIVCSPIAGQIAGRFTPHRVFTAVGTARCAVAAMAWIAIDAGAHHAVLVIALFVLVAVGTPSYPALMRVVHAAAPARSADRTVSVAAGLEATAFLGGPAVGGLLIAVGPSASLFTCASMCFASVWIVRHIPDAAASRCDGPATTAMRTTATWLTHPTVLPSIVAVLGTNVIAGVSAVLLVQLPDGSATGGDRMFGLMMFASGCGAVLAVVALVVVHRVIRHPGVALAGAGLSAAAVAATGSQIVAIAASTAFGAAIVSSEIIVSRTLARTLPGPSVAPAFGLLDSAMVVAMLAGTAVAPAVQAALGVRLALAASGVAAVVAASLAIATTSATASRLPERIHP